MNLFKRKPAGAASDEVTDKVAQYLAALILKVRRFLSGMLNHWFDQYSLRQQKVIVISVGILSGFFLLAGTFSSFYTVPKLSQSFSTAHIGIASDIPQPHHSKKQLTDPLTLKSK